VLHEVWDPREARVAPAPETAWHVLGLVAAVLRGRLGRLVGDEQPRGLAQRMAGLEVGHDEIIGDLGVGLLVNRDAGQKSLRIVIKVLGRCEVGKNAFHLPSQEDIYSIA
jgi:hypothetical protein